MLFSSSRQVALATYHAAAERWPNAKITLRNRGAGDRGAELPGLALIASSIAVPEGSPADGHMR